MTTRLRQGALCVVVDVERGKRTRLDEAIARMATRLEHAFRETTRVHFARFAVLPPATGMDGRQDGPAKLVFETHFDEPYEEHVRELSTLARSELEEIYGQTLDVPDGPFTPEGLRAYFDRHGVSTAARFLSHPGLTVEQIRNDLDLRRRIDAWLDRPDAPRFGDARSLAFALTSEFASDVAKAAAVPKGRGLLPEWISNAMFNAMIPALYVLGGAIMLAVRPLEVLVDPSGDPRSPEILREGSPKLRKLMANEDTLLQNGLTHVVAIKRGVVRHTALRLGLKVVDTYAKLVAGYQGRLGGITSIHFARWLFLSDDRLLFMSNYDGSWESYLGDFVDKVSDWLNAVWAHTVGYPPTRFVVKGGAEEEEPFKRWTRACQVANSFFFSAYPELTVRNVLDNARVRELLGREASEGRARTLARLL